MLACFVSRSPSSPAPWCAGFPASTKSFALIVDDGIPASATSIPEGGPLPDGVVVGSNDFGKTAYGGPCPPIGRHRYFHKLYALDVALGRLDAPTKADLESAMRGHVLGTGVLVGTYQKSK